MYVIFLKNASALFDLPLNMYTKCYNIHRRHRSSIHLNNLSNGRNNEILNKHVLRSLQREEDSIRYVLWFQGQSWILLQPLLGELGLHQTRANVLSHEKIKKTIINEYLSKKDSMLK